MIILICKDGATQVPREVKSLEEAQAFADMGHPVLVQNDDGSKVPLADAMWLEQTKREMREGIELAATGSIDKAADPPPQGFVAKVKAAVTRKRKA